MFEQARMFQCPNCNETIDASATQCRFCSVAIDPEQAEAASVVMAKVNQACSDASFLKTAAGAILVAFAFQFVPIVSGLGALAFLVLLVAVPAMALRWWVKFSRVVTKESDFKRARRTVAVVGAIVTLFLAIRIALFVAAIVAPHRHG
jgi:hypothetical protein